MARNGCKISRASTASTQRQVRGRMWKNRPIPRHSARQRRQSRAPSFQHTVFSQNLPIFSRVERVMRAVSTSRNSGMHSTTMNRSWSQPPAFKSATTKTFRQPRPNRMASSRSRGTRSSQLGTISSLPRRCPAAHSRNESTAKKASTDTAAIQGRLRRMG